MLLSEALVLFPKKTFLDENIFIVYLHQMRVQSYLAFSLLFSHKPDKLLHYNTCMYSVIVFDKNY